MLPFGLSAGRVREERQYVRGNHVSLRALSRSSSLRVDSSLLSVRCVEREKRAASNPVHLRRICSACAKGARLSRAANPRAREACFGRPNKQANLCIRYHTYKTFSSPPLPRGHFLPTGGWQHTTTLPCLRRKDLLCPESLNKKLPGEEDERRSGQLCV